MYLWSFPRFGCAFFTKDTCIKIVEKKVIIIMQPIFGTGFECVALTMPLSAVYVGSWLGFGTEPTVCTEGLRFWLFSDTKSTPLKNATKLCLWHYFCTDKSITLRSSQIENNTVVGILMNLAFSFSYAVDVSVGTEACESSQQGRGVCFISVFGYVWNRIVSYCTYI